MTTKICPTCGRQKPLWEFWKDRTRSDGLYWRCKLCAREPNRRRFARWYEKNRNYHIARCLERQRLKRTGGTARRGRPRKVRNGSAGAPAPK